MTPQEWAASYTLLRAAYPAFFRQFGQVDVQAWYELLNDLDGADVLVAVKEIAQANPYPPAIATIRERAKLVRARHGDVGGTGWRPGE
ncbi:Loader and inhibitor of phage G40P [compost metagenome]